MQGIIIFFFVKNYTDPLKTKEALIASNGDIENAIKFLISKGNIAKAKVGAAVFIFFVQKLKCTQDGRVAAEGKLGVATESSKGVVIEVTLLQSEGCSFQKR